jgi:hypothetical protein
VGLLLVFASTLAGLQVSGELECPTPAAIEQRLLNLLPSGTHDDRALVSASAAGVDVELRRADSSLIGSRTISQKATCDETAEAIAVTIAAWEAQIRPFPEAPIELPSTQPLTLQKAGPPQSSLIWEVEAGFLGSIAGNAFAPGASADVFLGRLGFPLGARIGVAGTDTREIALGAGQAGWGRAALSVGPNVEILSRVVRLDVHADVLGALLFMQGQGFSANYSDNAFDVALGGGLRAAVERWSVTPWIDVTLLGWLLHQNATADDAGMHVAAEIPRFDVWLRAGIAYGRRR